MSCPVGVVTNYIICSLSPPLFILFRFVIVQSFSSSLLSAIVDTYICKYYLPYHLVWLNTWPHIITSSPCVCVQASEDFSSTIPRPSLPYLGNYFGHVLNVCMVCCIINSHQWHNALCAQCNGLTMMLVLLDWTIYMYCYGKSRCYPRIQYYILCIRMCVNIMWGRWRTLLSTMWSYYDRWFEEATHIDVMLLLWICTY